MKKAYEFAKEEGDKGWELVLISSAESDIKIATMESVRIGEPYTMTKQRVDAIIKHCVDTLETPILKEMCAKEFPLFASRIYIQWVRIYGNRNIAMQLLALLRSERKRIPKKVEAELIEKAQKSDASSYIDLTKNGHLYSGTLHPFTATGEYHGEKGKDKHKIPMSSTEDMEVDRTKWNWANETEQFSEEVNEEIRRRVEEVLAQQAKEEYEKGYPSVRASAERALRWEWQQEQMEEMRKQGIKLVWISTHVNCSKRCQPFQGKLYSLDKTKGEIDGFEFVPIEVATDIYYTTKAGRVWKNGCLSGFNCRHKMIPYDNGNKPDEIPDDEIAKARELEEEQRAMERMIRKLKLRLRATRDRAERAKLKVQIRHLEAQYLEFCREHDLPAMIWRTEV